MIAVYIIAAVLLLILVFKLYAAGNTRRPVVKQAEKLVSIELLSEPDQPTGFGRKNSWFALKTNNPQLVAEIIGLNSVVISNWHTGIMAAYSYPSDYVFVTPEIMGWVLAVGNSLPQPEYRDKARHQWHQIMSMLSERFDETMFFATHRVSSYAAWARFQKGSLRRLFITGDGEVEQEGEPFAEEMPMLDNLSNIEVIQEAFSQALLHGEKPIEHDYLNEEDFVLELAGKWSINPDTFHELQLPPSCGLAGRLVCSR